MNEPRVFKVVIKVSWWRYLKWLMQEVIKQWKAKENKE